MTIDTVTINRAPVLTLWGVVVAEALGFEHDEALTLGKAVAGLNAYSKGKALGIFKPTPKDVKARRAEKAKAEQPIQVDLMGRAVVATQTAEGLRALAKDKPIAPGSVEKYLAGKFKESLGPVTEAMTQLARSMEAEELAEKAYRLYEQFRPGIPAGEAGWGAAGELSLVRIRNLVKEPGA